MGRKGKGEGLGLAVEETWFMRFPAHQCGSIYWSHVGVHSPLWLLSHISLSPHVPCCVAQMCLFPLLEVPSLSKNKQLIKISLNRICFFNLLRRFFKMQQTTALSPRMLFPWYTSKSSRGTPWCWQLGSETGLKSSFWYLWNHPSLILTMGCLFFKVFPCQFRLLIPPLFTIQ